MKRKVYITALCVALAAGAAGQDCTGVNAPLRPSAPRAGRTAASREWGYRDIYPKKTIDRPGDRQRSGEAAYYPYVVSAPSLPVRSAPAYDAPALATLPEGEVIHLAAAPYPWKSMRITYFDAEAWTYRTAVGYVDGQCVRTPTSAAANRRSDMRVPLYVDRHGAQSLRPRSRPIAERTRAVAPAANRQRIEPKGRLAVWTDCGHDGHIDVYIDGEYAGRLTESFLRATPACGEDGTVGRDVAAGRHDVAAFGASLVWSGEVMVAPGQCLLKQLAGH